MKKQEFISELQRLLSKLPAREVRERLVFYSEMIDDKKEEGLSEDDAVASVGTPKVIASQITDEIRSQKKKTKEKRKLKPWEITVLILGSPLWIVFLAVAASVVLSIFAVMLSVNLALWALEIPFFIFSLLSQYLIIACKSATKLTLFLIKKFIETVKKFFGAKDRI